MTHEAPGKPTKPPDKASRGPRKPPASSRGAQKDLIKAYERSEANASGAQKDLIKAHERSETFKKAFRRLIKKALDP